MPALPEILVMGDGFAGRAMALAWAQSGGTATIIAPKTTHHLSGGVQLAPNGWAALKTLAVDDAAQQSASPLSMMRLLSCTTGNSLVQINLNTPRRRPYTGMDRGGLMAVLADACTATSRITWHDGAAQNLTSQADGATLTLADGKTLIAPFIIGADGANGIARAYVMAEDTPTPPAETRHAFRCVIPLDQLPDLFAAKATSVWLGDGAHLVFYPLAGGMLNLVLVTTAGTSSHRQALALLRAQPLLAPLIPFVEAVNPAPLYRYAPLDTLRRGRVILAGDAAHPMPPHLAQGAGQSLVDAASLQSALTAAAVSDISEISGLFTTWSASRLKATRSIQQKADRAGRLFGLDGPMAALRNIGLSTLGGPAMEHALDTIWQS